MKTGQIVSLSFFRFARGLPRFWALAMMGLARPSMARVPGIGFWKLCGSGTGEGFTPIPNTGVYAILATWPDRQTADAQIAKARIFQRYRQAAEENYTLLLEPLSVRGQWSGQIPFQASNGAKHADKMGPIAALTRATVRPRAALRFWSRVPDISAVIGGDENVAFKIGIGEVPLLHQITFSVWPDTEGMAHFARRDGPHARAIKAVRDGNWFSEELYARFAILGEIGSWGGERPLARLGETS